MKLTTKYMAIFSTFLFGVLVVAVGSKSETQLVILGQTFPVFALTRAVGLLMMLGSIITALAVYGNSLPLSRFELEGQGRGRTWQVLPKEITTEHPGDKHVTPTGEQQADHALAHPGRVSTEAKLRLIVAKKRAKAEELPPIQKRHAA